MGTSRKRAWEYAEKALARPSRAVPVVLRHGRSGVTLLHNGRVLTRCYPTGVGRRVALLMARALGVELPPVGGSVATEVPSGVLWRVLNLSHLDLRVPGTEVLAERLLAEAEFQRRRAGGPTA